MKRIIWLLVLLLLVACSGGADTLAPDDVAEPGAEAEPTAAEATTAPTTGGEAATPADTTAAADDPTLARERDWKLGDLAEPAVTIIEYGDFQ